jgi:ubiquinone/menaquinone biosynthesis C-methylase UbiE
MINHITIVDDKSKTNIELDAGDGSFGHKFIANCYKTEYRTRKEIEAFFSQNYIDVFEVNALNLQQWNNGNRFNKVWMCNPFGYGFQNEETTHQLIKELCRVLTNKGEIVVIGSESNRWCTPTRIKKNVGNLIIDSVILTVGDICALSDEYKLHKFYQLATQTETKPNFQISIYVSKSEHTSV